MEDEDLTLVCPPTPPHNTFAFSVFTTAFYIDISSFRLDPFSRTVIVETLFTAEP